jgi:uncharacterized membrane protein/protein-disulfide isomerase
MMTIAEAPPVPTGPDLRPPRSRVVALWAIRGLCVVALVLVSYLIAVSAAERTRPAGCGEGSGCEQVLASKWGLWFNVPVSYPAAAAYAALLMAACVAGPRSDPTTRRAAWLAMAALAALVAASAVWFVVVQVVVLKAFCPWCTGLHACGVAIALLVWRGMPTVRATEHEGVRYDPDALPRSRPLLAALAGALGVAVLVGGQLASTVPEKHQVVRFASGFGDIDTRKFPVVGPAASPNLLLVMNDYTCPHCRSMHQRIDQARERYGASSFAIAVATVPLNRDCNVLMRGTDPHHVNSCDLTKFAIAVWRAAPEKFPEYDRWLYEPEKPREPGDARRKATELVGAEALDRAMADGFVLRQIQDNVALYGKAGGGRLPKVIVPSGETAAGDAASGLFDTLEKRFKLTATKPQ